ncbi:MAG: DMT family transporter [Acidobacteriota bacterium]
MSSPGDGRLASVLIPIACSLTFAGSFLAGKRVITELGPFTSSLLRFVLAAITLALLLRWQRETLGRPNRHQLGWLALAGTLGIAGYQTCFFVSLAWTSATNAALVNASGPLLTALLARLLVGERLTRAQALGTLVASLGVLVLLTGGDPAALLRLQLGRGELVMLVAVLAWALHAIVVKRLARELSTAAVSFHVTWLGVLVLLLPALGWESGLETRSLSSAFDARPALHGTRRVGRGLPALQRQRRPARSHPHDHHGARPRAGLGRAARLARAGRAADRHHARQRHADRSGSRPVTQ